MRGKAFIVIPARVSYPEHADRHTTPVLKAIEHSNCNCNCANAKRLERFLSTRRFQPLDAAHSFPCAYACESQRDVEIRREESHKMDFVLIRGYKRSPRCQIIHRLPLDHLSQRGDKRLGSSSTNSRRLRYVRVCPSRAFHCDVFFFLFFFYVAFYFFPAVFTSDILCTPPRVTSHRVVRYGAPGRTGLGINKGNDIRAKCPFLCGLARGVNDSKHAPASL